ncbi:VCBS repeat-containing protein [Myxococcus sp. K38C18041901]|uniref:FG-GAP repeat domain-containing protein n=1 Tax=Myxococcus guangdongensis TaxID=2906760 RepID=UPI0020A70957|nr:VCBS repeat-containing protein [Myxococcus guangdongensis]MCP3057716.1 VCBS repeat-containing protein [Myxococcus guangdongensis]
MKRFATPLLRLCTLVFALTLALPGISQAALVSFCSDTLGQPGSNVISYKGTYSGGLASGLYKITVSQSGTFTLLNLLGTWDGYIVGAYQNITGPGSIGLSGIIPSGTPPGLTATVTYSIHNTLGQLVDQSSTRVIAGGQSPGWTWAWTAPWGQGGVETYAKHYVGDFDGDGAEDILGVATNGWMTMFHFRNGTWQWGWSNNGSPSAGGGIYDYRNNLVIGDFDGDGKDEALGVTSWVTLFHFDNGTWNWGWSNYGSTSDQLHAHSTGGGYLLSGNFDLAAPAQKDELVGVSASGWITLFRLNAAGTGWDWLWSTHGNTAHGLYGYRHNLRNGGDTNGDGKEELLGLSSWATNFSYVNGDFAWGWSTYGANHIGGFGYPLGASDALLTGNIDADAKDEWFFIQSGPSASWAATEDWTGGNFGWNWSNHNTSPVADFIGDWPLANYGGSDASYLLVRAVAGQPKYLVARRTLCGQPNMKMYRVSNLAANY